MNCSRATRICRPRKPMSSMPARSCITVSRAEPSGISTSEPGWLSRYGSTRRGSCAGSDVWRRRESGSAMRGEARPERGRRSPRSVKGKSRFGFHHCPISWTNTSKALLGCGIHPQGNENTRHQLSRSTCALNAAICIFQSCSVAPTILSDLPLAAIQYRPSIFKPLACSACCRDTWRTVCSKVQT